MDNKNRTFTIILSSIFVKFYHDAIIYNKFGKKTKLLPVHCIRFACICARMYDGDYGRYPNKPIISRINWSPVHTQRAQGAMYNI